MNELGTFREKVREIDKEIINLIWQRIEITKKIGEKKKKKSIPLRNWELEKSIIENATAIAKNLGISQSLIKSIMQQLIMESVIQQERLHYSAYNGYKENILIIGGLGEMGEWFSYFFQNQGHNVSIYDIKGKSAIFKSFKKLSNGIKKASCVLIASSLNSIPEIIDELTQLNFKGIIFDIASLKGHLLDSIKRANEKGIKITSIHPMFSSNVRTLIDKVICFCDCGNQEANKKVMLLFKNTAASIVELSLQEHDRLISYVLGLSHIINIIFIKVLMEGNYKYIDLKNVASTTFNSQMVTAISVINENPDLYYAIQRFNPFNENLYKQLKEVVESITLHVLKGNKDIFVEVMEEGKKWLEEV
jgi:chorismate mutase/prephenate dehydrogenase